MTDANEARPSRRTHRTTATPRAEADDVEADAPKTIIQDEPSPEVVALFLRPKKAAVASTEVQAPKVSSAVKGPDVAPVDESLIDSLTRIVTEMLQAHVRESVTAAVRALAPRLVVSLPPEGEEGTTGGNQLRSRPTQLRSRQPRAPGTGDRHD